MKKFLQRDIYRERMLINGILILMSAWYIGSCLWVSLQRADYPYELEWCESPIIDQALRIYDHEPYYVPPSLEWVTLIYTPLYFYLGAFSMKILGVSFAALRIISILSTIGIGVLIYKILRSQGGDDTSSISAPGLFFAAYSATGAWYDLARVDMLALLLAVLAALFMIRGDKPKNAVLSALCITLAFFTKQSFLILIILFAVHWFLAGRKSFLYYFIIVGTNLAAGFLFLHFQSQGLFWYYTFTAPAKHDLFSDRWLTFWTKDIILKYPVMSVLTVYILYFTVRKLWMNFFDYRRSALVFIVIGFFLTAWMGRLKVGGYDNTVIPAVIALALLSGIAMNHFRLHSYGLAWILPVTVKIFVLLQFILMAYKPWPNIPNGADKAAGKRIIETIENIDGAVYIPNHGYYARMAGKETYTYWMAAHDIMHAEGSIQAESLPVDLKRAVENKFFSAVIIDEPLDFWEPVISPYYELEETLFSQEEDRIFWQKTGMPTRPQYLFVPKID